MKKISKACLLIMSVLLFVLSIPAVQISAATSEPAGTDQKFLKIAPESGNYNYFYATEEGKEFLVYCFNSKLAWPEYENEGSYDILDYGYTVPYKATNINSLSERTQDLLYRVFYAGYPHNNAGLYIENNDAEIKPERINAALQTSEEILGMLGLSGVELSYYGDGTGTIEQMSSEEGKKFLEACETLANWGYSVDPEETEKFDYILGIDSKFALLALAYNDAVSLFEDVALLPSVYYAYVGGSDTEISGDSAHDQTQLAVWYVLSEQNVDNNLPIAELEKQINDAYDEDAFIYKLIEFAYGDDPVPDRKTSFSDMAPYVESFNNKEHLLNESNENVGAAGGIKFSRNPFDGKYYSEKLHFSDDEGHETYISPFEISVMDEGDKLSSMVTYGKDTFVLVSDEVPTGAHVKLESTNYWPSPIYQYSTTQRSSLYNKDFQEMSGVYFEQVDLGFEVPAIVESGDLIVKKTVDGVYADLAKNQTFDFRANVAIYDADGNQLSGDLPYKIYNLDIRGEITGDSISKGTITNTGELTPTTDYNMEFSLKAGTAIVFENLPLGTIYSVNENVDGNWTPTYIVDGVEGNSGSLTAKDTVEIRNIYAYDPVEINVSGTKMLKKSGTIDVEFETNDFSFVLKQESALSPMPEDSDENSDTGLYEKVVKNQDDKFDFGKIIYDTPGVYTYVIEELETTKENVSIDPLHYYITVTIEDENSTGELSKSITIYAHNNNHEEQGMIAPDNGNIVVNFRNEYNEEELDEEIKVVKIVQNNASDTDEKDRSGYVFKISPAVTDEETLNNYPIFKDGDKEITVVTGASGEAITPMLLIKKDNFDSLADGGNTVELVYNITEDTSDLPDGITCTNNDPATATITVTKTAEGYTSSISYTYKHGNTTVTGNEAAYITNEYNAKADLELKISKTISSQFTYTPEDYETYIVKINADFSANDPEGFLLPADGVMRLEYDPDEKEFVAKNNSIIFTKTGKYTFELVEEIGDVEGIEYDTNKWLVEVFVDDNEDGTLSVEEYYYSEKAPLVSVTSGAEFVNTYRYELDVPIKLKKTLVGRPLSSHDSFTINITHCEGSGVDPLIYVATYHTGCEHETSVVLDDVGGFEKDIKKGAIIHEPGIYYMLFEEKVPEGTTMAYDKTSFVMEIVVVQDGNKLKLEDEYPKYYRVDEGKGWNDAVELTDDVFEFVNKITNLNIKKTATGFKEDVVFGFDVVLTDKSGTPLADTEINTVIAGDHEKLTTDSEGKVYIELLNNQTIRITELPDGTKYTIEEVVTPSAKTEITVTEDGEIKTTITSKKVSDSLTAGIDEEVLIKNTKKTTPGGDTGHKIVDTGDNSRTGAYMAMAGLSAIGLILVSMTIKKYER